MAKIMTLEMLTYYDSKIKEHLKNADDALSARISQVENNGGSSTGGVSEGRVQEMINNALGQILEGDC